jgi:hypothetical protein
MRAAFRVGRSGSQCLAVEVTGTAVFDGGRAVQTLHELRAL